MVVKCHSDLQENMYEKYIYFLVIVFSPIFSFFGFWFSFKLDLKQKILSKIAQVRNKNQLLIKPSRRRFYQKSASRQENAPSACESHS